MIDYQIHDVSENQIKITQWYLGHKKQIAKIPVILLAVLCLATLIYGFSGIVNYLIKLPQENLMLAGLTVNNLDFAGWQERHRPKPLIISDPQVLYNGGESYDFIVQVKNPNEDRGVMNLTYQFITAGDFTPTTSVVILPKQTVYLLSLGNTSARKLNKASLRIIETQWQNLWQKDFPEVEITTSEPIFQPARGNSRSWVSFSATNNSLRNIWEITFQAVLYSGRRVVAANQQTTEEFLAGETQPLELSWFERLPKITQIDIVPLVDVYDEDLFFQKPGQAGELD